MSRAKPTDALPLPGQGAASASENEWLGPEGGRDETVTIKVAGLGGQGVLLVGVVLAEAGMREGREVSWLPSYGPEMRSGSAHCHVCLSGKRIGSPVVDNPDVLVAMNEISLRKFAPDVAPGGLILYNRGALPEGFSQRQARVVCVAGSEIADKMGTSKAANMVMLGALVGLTGALRMETVVRVLEGQVHDAALLDADRRALDAGRAACKAPKNS